jgi:CRISPR-associated protein Cmr2
MTDTKLKVTAALAWCLAWGDKRESHLPLPTLKKMQKALLKGQGVPAETREIVQQIEKLDVLNHRLNSLPFPSLVDIKNEYPELWQQQTAIGLVYGGATKIKGYVFEASNLQDIRGASALLDRINLVDLPAFFGQIQDKSVSQWLTHNFSGLKEALIPELIIYSTGGNILAFCPAAFVDDLANAIEKRYTEETLTANSCAVGESFRLLEIRLGLLKDPIEETFWLEDYRKNYQQPLVQSYFGHPQTEAEIVELFKNRKSFNELAGKLASLFQQRRNGNEVGNGSRPSRRYPPIFETHPDVVRDENEQRSAIAQTNLPGDPWFSDTLARKRIVGQRVKREGYKGQQWYNKNTTFRWQFGSLKKCWNSGKLESWVFKFGKFLKQTGWELNYYKNQDPKVVKEAIFLGEIGNASDDFVAFIYADGNNMGGYIQKIKSPEEYAEFSKDVFEATEQSVYRALAKHLGPHYLQNLKKSDAKYREGTWIHPFEIIAIGGDDVMLIVPANQALAIAQTLGEEFEKILLTNKTTYQITQQDILTQSVTCHRYHDPQNPPQPSQCQLSMSTGVLITSSSTPIYYAEKLTNQLLKSAKKKAKTLKGDQKYRYHGGTIDILTLKSVTMISSNIQEFRENGLTKEQGNQTLRLYGAPYTLYEIGGLIKTIAALKESEFPRSQLYQIRSLLEQGKRTVMLNYLYFRSRLKPDQQRLLKQQFDEAWCQAKTNSGNIVPWMYESQEKVYETIWREMVDLYPFINAETVASSQPGHHKESRI